MNHHHYYHHDEINNHHHYYHHNYHQNEERLIIIIIMKNSLIHFRYQDGGSFSESWKFNTGQRCGRSPQCYELQQVQGKKNLLGKD